jgi:hypothetical protein
MTRDYSFDATRLVRSRRNGSTRRWSPRWRLVATVQACGRLGSDGTAMNLSDLTREADVFPLANLVDRLEVPGCSER